MVARPAEIEDLSKKIAQAIREELEATSRGLPFRAWDVVRREGHLYMILEPEGRQSILDESLEEGRMSWEGNAPGSAEVISVLPSTSVVNACLTSGRPPQNGAVVFFNPPRYLETLLALWEKPEHLSHNFVSWYFQLGNNNITGPPKVPSDQFSSLRPAQRASFDLIRWSTSFLWGPPGTGKTHTLGRILAAYLVRNPGERVLLLSSTNVAVDLAILAVDDALNEIKPQTRPVCFRFGSRFDPKRLDERKHLTPLRDKSLVGRLRQHYELIPDPADADRYRLWKQQRDRLRDAIRAENLEFLSQARLAAMTTTLAAQDFENLGRFDVVVFDEASQVGKAQAMTFAHLGKRSLYAGDPKQLAPIAQASSPDVDTWLGRSPFEWISRTSLASATCMLDEQWRMAEPIGTAVSTLFYESKLKVAVPAAEDAKWRANRTARATQLLPTTNIVLIETGAAPVAAKQFRGYECLASAQLIAAILADHVLNWPIEDVKSDLLVLTPYRAQRRKIEEELRSVELPSSLVSTVHRAQGSERKIVVFDPVCPTAEFVSGEAGMRLVNVAFSRAQCRLAVCLQQGWEENPALFQLSKLSSPLRPDPELVSRLLLAKLGKNRSPMVEPQQPRTSTPTLKSAPKTLFDEFREELRKQGVSGKPKNVIQRAVVQLTDKAKFRQVSYREIDRVIEEFSNEGKA